MNRRVVVTGMAAITPIGNDWQSISASFAQGVSGIRYLPEWEKYEGLNTHLGAPAAAFELPDHYSRKRTRSMGRVALLGVRASERALEQSGLIDDPMLKGGTTGVAYGSSSGSPDSLADFASMLVNSRTDGLTANSYIKMMSHTAAINIAIFFGATGRVIPTSSACTSGSQAIGYAYEAIKYGAQEVMIAGGAEELSATQAAVFDTLFATSTRNDAPSTTPRPFDRDRDGLVIGEGAASLVLEDLDHARARGATVIAEIMGFATNCDGTHVTQPNPETIQSVMECALNNAELEPSQIGYVSAHGTATDRGDIAESHATSRVFKQGVPVSSLKSFTGHTLGACGAIESYVAINSAIDGRFHPTLNLKNLDERCAQLDYILDTTRALDVELVMNNNFAFGGVNTSLIFRRWTD